MSTTGSVRLCADFKPTSASSGACSGHGGLMTSGSLLFTLLRWLLPLALAVYLWRRGGRGALARLRGLVPFVASPSPRRATATAPPQRRLRILFLAANPTSSTRLDLTREARQIKDRLDGATRASRVELVTEWAARRSDLQRLLLEVEPDVLHFSGHGSARSQILLEDDEGNPAHVEKDALVNLLGILPGRLRLVVLNACDTEPVAEALVQHIACAIGMHEPIGNEAAIAFATAFYQALGFGQPVANAFRLGCNALELLRIPEEGTPSLKVAPGVDAETLVITAQ
jgi:hypothetical protein